MTVKLGLAGDTMLGRMVAERVAAGSPLQLFSSDLVAVAHEADLFVLNLECCVSERGERWPAPGKPFFFRAPPAALDALGHLGVDCVTLANNHALDFGYDALLDTFEHLDSAGIRWVGAGPDLARARRPVVLEHDDLRVAVAGMTDHPEDFAAGENRPGVAFARLREGVPRWLLEDVEAREGGVFLVSPHWGPNMTAAPLPYVCAAARTMIERGATLVAGHSAHVFHGVEGRVLYDLGDFIDDYRVDPVLRNDLGLLFLITLDDGAPVDLQAIPLKLDYCHTRLAHGDDYTWVVERFRTACAELGTEVREDDGRLVLAWPRTNRGEL